MTVVYIKYNDSRQAAYQLVTTIIDDDGGRYALKTAATETATGFLDSLNDKFQTLSAPGFPLKPLEPLARDEGVRFDYLAGDSMDFLVGQAVRNRDRDGALAVFRSYRELVDRIPLAGDVSAGSDFRELFGEVDTGGLELIATGCLDLILENIYPADGKYLLIDYEWTFDFPLPKALVLLRTVMNTYYKYHAHGINQLLPAAELLAALGIDPGESERLQRMEWNFQTAVNDRVQTYEDFQALYQRVLYEPFDAGVTIADMREQFDAQAGRLARAEEELGHARRMLGDRDNEIASMRASKFWRLRELYLKLRRLAAKLKR